MPFRGLIESGTDYLGAAAGAFHVGDFLGAFVDQKNEQIGLGVILQDGVGQFLHENRLAGPRRSDNQAARTFANWADEVQNACGELVVDGFENESLVWKQRRQVVEMGLIFGLIGVFLVDGLDFEQREKALFLFWGADLTGDKIAGLQIEAADLRGGNINIFGAGQIIKAL